MHNSDQGLISSEYPNMVKRKDLQCPDYWKSFLVAVFGKKFLDTLAGGCLMVMKVYIKI